MKVDKVWEGVVVDEVPDQELEEWMPPLLKVADDCFLMCGALVNRGLMGKKIRVTVEVFDGHTTTT